MRVLILTCNTGEGHNSAAKAVKEELDRRGVYCEIADSLAFLSPKASNFICKWHVRLYKKAPTLFGIGYKAAEYSESRSKKHKSSMFLQIVSKGASKLNAKLTKGNYDAIVCTHPFSAFTVTRAIKKYHITQKTYFIATDYTCSPGVSSSRLDYYIIPHESLYQEFENHGIAREKLFAGGIPVKNKKGVTRTREESRKNLLIPDGKRVILLMCGSMGCGPMKIIARKLSTLIKDEEKLVVICGNNKALYKSLRMLDDPGRVRILGYTRNIPDYMNVAELLLTKPGGLSTTEAAQNKLPMILIDAVSGCETHNMKFWVENKMALTSDDYDELCGYVRSLMDNEDSMSYIKKNIEEKFSFDSVTKIAEFIISNEKTS